MNFQNGRKIFTLWTFGCPTYNWTETRPISCLKFQLQSKIRKPQYWNARRRNEVRWHPGQETSLVPICSNPRSLGRKCTVLKKGLVTLLGLIGARGIVPPCPPRYAPARMVIVWSSHRSWKLCFICFETIFEPDYSFLHFANAPWRSCTNAYMLYFFVN